MTQNQFTGGTLVSAPTLEGYRTSWRLAFHYALSAARAKDSNAVVPSILLTVRTDEWLFLDSAHGLGGTALEAVVLDREVVSANYLVESLVILVDRSVLDKWAASGTRVLASGARGRVELDLPAVYVRGFLDRLDSAFAPEAG